MSRASTTAACAVAAVLGVVLYKLHLPQKWDAAVTGTLAPFWYLTGVFRERWAYVRFWISISISFVLHILLTWVVFSVVLRTDTMGIFVWIPAIMLEGVGLYYLIGGFDKWLACIIQQKPK
jgi:hypothetical protein